MSASTAAAEANAVITATLAQDHAEQTRIVLDSDDPYALAVALASLFAAGFEELARMRNQDPQLLWSRAATLYAAQDAR